MPRVYPVTKPDTELTFVPGQERPVISRLRRMGQQRPIEQRVFRGFHADWERYGPEIIEFVRTHYPLAYFKPR